jgi:hypothetical protein
MPEYSNINRGAIWGNDDKREDKHPDFKGSLNVNGVEFWVSAWKRKEGASPKSPALSFSVKPKEEKPAPKAGNAAQYDDMDGDRIPF